MKPLMFQVLAIACLLCFFLFWLIGGAHGGWSQDSITEMQIDELTGIEFSVTKDGFLPGIEFLAVGFLGFATFMTTSAFLKWRIQRLSASQA